MITLRKADERGQTRLDWLDSRHTFSFGDYADPRHHHFRALRVINDDWVKPGAGFGMHPHRDMEIVTYVLSGRLEHRDSLGNGSIITPGDVQRMTAGKGIWHAEFNPSAEEPVRLLQIWIVPEERGLEPSYEEKRFELNGHSGNLCLVASRDGRAGSVTIHQDADVLAGRLAAGETATHSLSSGRYAWIQVARGALTLNGQPLEEGDGAAVSEETTLALQATTPAEVLVFDLA